MNLRDLPQFTIDERHADPGADEVRFVGRLSHLRGVRNPFGCLYISAAYSVLGNLEALPVPWEVTTFRAVAWSVPADLGPGASLPWLDGYWEPYQIEMVLDTHHRWERRVFVAEPAHYFELNGVRGWQQAGLPLPYGARDLGIQEGGWDHEHCDLCRAHVGAAGAAEGYVDADEHWLCIDCYERYAARHDISFATEE